jgi:uncharacterized membrane protein YczE
LRELPPESDLSAPGRLLTSVRPILAALRPSPRVPVTPWSAQGSFWRASALTLGVLAAGLCLFGLGEGALVSAGLGTAPWTVLAQGIAGRTPLDIGAATIVVSAVVMLGWVPLRQRPGLGTLANMILIGISLDLASRLLPHPAALGWRFMELAAGIGAVAVGSGLYLTANLGPGPRDGWMTGIHRRTGIGIASVRTGLELFVLTVGIALGGHAGIGTVAFALLVGYGLAATFRIMTRLAPAPSTS